MPARATFGPRQADAVAWLLWSAPVWFHRKLTGRVDCTVVVYRLSAHDSPVGRSLHREHTTTMEDAVASADRLVETLEDGNLPSGGR